MRYCVRCLYPENHPLNLVFDEDGICSGCRVHEEKDTLDWNERGRKLAALLQEYRNRSGRNYDCVVPVSGARDSYFIVHTIKNVYKMNPLLVSYNKHFNTDLGIRNLSNLRIKFDCDFYQLSIAPETVKKITRATMRRRGSLYWHCIAGQTVYPVQMAVKFKIPLIIWGAHQGIDQVGMYSHLDEVEMTRKYRKEHDLMGVEAEDLIDQFDFIEEKDVAPYLYPDDKELESVGVRGIYLNNFLRWDSKKQHEEMIRLYGYETGPQTRTFDTYNDIDCFNYSDIHDYIKFLKWGYGKVNDHVAREIRLKRLTRNEGRQLIDSYLYRPPKNMDLFLSWIGMSKNGFNHVIDQHRSPSVWHRTDEWRWELQSKIPHEILERSGEKATHERKEPCNFLVTASKRPDYEENRYVLIGKGYPAYSAHAYSTYAYQVHENSAAATRQDLISNVNVRATALKEFWTTEHPHSLYLWQGAKHDKTLREIQHDPVPTFQDLFVTQPQIKAGFDFCRAFYERALATLAKRLNGIHGREFSESFWRICFGQWLFRHIVVVYDKFEVLRRIDIDSVGIRLLDKSSFFVPRDHYEYLLCFIKDFGVQQLVSQYFYLYGSKERATVQMGMNFEPIDFCNIPDTEANNSLEIALLGTFISGKTYSELVSRSGGRIGHLGLPKHIRATQAVDWSARGRIAERGSGGAFEEFFFQTLYYCMPRDFIENFTSYVDAFEPDLHKRNPQMIVAEAWISHIPSAIYLGLAKEQQKTVACFEHGFGMLFYPKYPGRFVDMDACDLFISVGWGETNGRFVKGGFAGREVKPYNLNLDGDGILFISRTKSIYQFELSEGMVTNESFVRELQVASNFIDLLPENLRKSFSFRPRDKDVFFWDTELALELKDRDITIDRDPDFARSILRSNIVVIDHISTGFAELLLMGVPFILLNAVSKIECSDELRTILAQLRVCGVIHESADSAVKHLQSIHSDVKAWWGDPRVVSAVDRLRNFMIAPDSKFTEYLLSRLNDTFTINEVDASFSLALQYLKGDESARDYQSAAHYLSKAAVQGHVEAQTLIAEMCETGVGLPKDLAQAVSWYQKAAESGSIASLLRLGALYSRGDQIPQDLVAAYVCFSRAAVFGDETGINLQQRLEQVLSIEELRMGREYLNLHCVGKGGQPIG